MFDELSPYTTAPEQNDLFRMLVRNLPGMALMVFDKDLRYIAVEGPFISTLGYVPEEVIGKTLEEIAPVEAHAVLLPRYKAALAGIESEIERDNGTYIYQARFVPVRDRTGKIVAGMAISQDITQQRRAENALRETELRHKLLVENSLDAVLLTKPDGTILTANPAAARMYGRTEAEIVAVGRDGITDLTDPRLATLIREREETGRSHGEITGIRKDGTRFPVEVSSQVFTANDGQILTSMIQRDVSERRQMENALRESEALYHGLFNQIDDAITIHDLEGRLLDVNEAACRRLGYSREELLQMRVMDIDEPTYGSHFAERLQHQLEHGKLANIEGVHVRRDGQRINIEVNSTAILYRGQTAILSVIRDITERKHIEDALRDSEERYRSVVNAMAEGIVLQDVDGVIRAGNGRAEAILGLTKDQMMGRTSIDSRWHAIHKDGSPFPGETHPAMVTLRTGQPLSNVVMGVHKPDGSLTWISINSQPVFHDGETVPSAVVASFTDVTEHKRISDSLVASEARYKMLAETISDVVCQADLEGNFVYVSPSVRTVLGYAPEEFMGKKRLDYLHPDEVPAFNDFIKGQIEERPANSQLKVRLKHKQGHYVWLETIIHAVTGETGETTGFISSMRDITLREQAEDALQESEARYRLLAENVGDVVCQADLEGNFVYVSPSCRTLLGYGPDELMGMQRFALIHPEDVAKTREEVHKILQEQPSTYIIAYRLLHKEGHYVWLESIVHSVRREDSSNIAYIASLRDITARKQAELALEESQRLSDRVARTVPAMIHIYDLVEQRVVYSNDRQTSIMGYATDLLQSISRPAEQEYIHPDDVMSVMRMLGSTLSLPDDTPVEVEFRSRHANGEWRWIHLDAIVFLREADGSARQILTVAEDITDHKQAEAQAFELYAEKERGRVLKTFIQDASHDLRTPLSIIGLILERRFQGKTDPRDIRDHNRVSTNLTRLTKILDDMEALLYLKDNTALAVTGVAINDLVRRQFDAFAGTIEEKQLHPTLDLAEGLPSIQAVPAELTLALRNIVENAVTFTPIGGQVTASTRIDGQSIRIEVKDTGPGILPEDLPHIFDSFYRADKNRSSKTGGTGLGLTIAKRIAERHGGRIEVESSADKGSTFCIVLPVGAPPAD